MKKNPNMSISKNLISYHPGRHLPLPPRYKTSFETYNTGYFTASSAYATNGYFVELNTLIQPFNNTFSVLPNPQINVSTQYPTGLTSLLNVNAYVAYRVYRSEIKFRLAPQVTSDNVTAVILPAADGTTATLLTAKSQPFATEMAWNPSQTQRWLKNSISLSKLAGVTARAIQDDLSLQYDGSIGIAPAAQYFWQIYIRDLNNNNVNTLYGWECYVTHYVELFNLQTGDLKQT
jgi:hypothetical protein